MADESADTPFRYHLELTPQQLKLTHTALRSLLDDFGHDESELHKLIHEVLDKLPDEHAIRAIQLDREPRAIEEILSRPSSAERESGDGPESGDEPPDSAA